MIRAIKGLLGGLALALGLSACASWNVDVSKLQLGMEPEAVQEAIGKPFTIRASRSMKARSGRRCGNICRQSSRPRKHIGSISRMAKWCSGASRAISPVPRRLL